MLRTLRNRLILSHILPFLIVIPLAGIAFIYILETKVILPRFTNELVADARLISELTSEQPELWQDTTKLEALIQRFKSQNDAQTMFYDINGLLLASSDPKNENQLGSLLSNDDIARVQDGMIIKKIKYHQEYMAEVIEVFAPVISSDNQLIGIIGISYPFLSIPEEFLQLRYIILGILAFALIIGVGLSSVLAITISIPLQHVTEAIDKLAKGDNLDYLEVQGPEEIKSLAKSTNLLFERIQNHEKTRKQLLANLIHELGRPLGALRSGIQSLKLGAGKDPQLLDDLTTGIDAEMVRLQELLDDLAHLHDQVYGFLELNRENITPQSWLPKVLRPWQEIAAEKELDWTLEIPENLPDFKADPLRLAQIIENLVSNAIKYTPKDGSVKIIAGNDPNNIWFKVCDTGPGIPPEDENKIFEPFYRGEQKDKIIRGMGLGLSIAHDLAIAHKGEILVDSKLGQGSTFTVSIPTD